jgi:hypothetical protein
VGTVFWWVATPIMRASIWWFRRYQPAHRGISIAIGTDDENTTLHLDRIKNALDLLAIHAPRYFNQLTSGVRVILIARIAKHHKMQLYDQPRILRMSPQWVFSHSDEQLALDFIAFAARIQLRRRGIRGATNLRHGRATFVAAKYRVWLADRLPNGQPLAQHWRDAIARAKEARAARASGHVEA